MEYVKRLTESIKQHASFDVEVVCLSDDPRVSQYAKHVELETDWSGWWSKLELFQQLESAVYFDLDTVIRGDITSLFEYEHEFTMLRDFLHPKFCGSGVMAWNGDYSYLADGFTMDQAQKYTKTGYWGDQGLIAEKLKHQPERFQEILPGMVASYKVGYTTEPVVCFHGNPRPHTVNWKV